MTALALAWATRALAACTCFCAWATEAVEPWTSEPVVLTLVLTLMLVMGTLTVAWMYCGLGAGEVGLGLLERRPGSRVGSISASGCAGLDRLVVLDVDLDDLAGDARADLVEIAVHLGVVGVLGEGGAPVEEAGADDEQQDDADDDELAAGLLRRRFGSVACVTAGRSAAALCRPAELCLCLPRLLSSEIIFVVGLSDAQGTGQGELGDVVLVERADVLVVGLFGLRLRLGDGQVVGDAGVEALLRFAECFVGEVDIGVGGVDQLGRGLDVEDGCRGCPALTCWIWSASLALACWYCASATSSWPWSWRSAGRER